ncbi:MAG TPA: dynamin family protein [Tepidisphaeraceae bacterium]|nr:dynamin family protein [Tepidisphaeraceae bacterium]
MSMTRQLTALDTALGANPNWLARYPALERVRGDLAAARFHMDRPSSAIPMIAILGGTGTGKSTLLNRLLNANLAAANVRRTFTAGPIAVTNEPSRLPANWLGVEHIQAAPDQLPARGEKQRLTIITAAADLLQNIILIDTPDLDGDEPAHHAQADSVFRWADAVLFLVTPEKYQMTELLAYYRLAKRYSIPTFYVMNKTQEQAVVDDYRGQIKVKNVFVVPRDDAGYEPPAQATLTALRSSLETIELKNHPDANAARVADLIDRLQDQVIEPMLIDRRAVDRLIQSLRAMQDVTPSVDVNPLTQQLQRRLQQRSVLYLMGPGMIIQRVRQVPAMLARLPRTTWDLLRGGKIAGNGHDDPPAPSDRPDFRTVLIDQFRIVQTRIDDALRSNSTSQKWIEASPSDYAATKFDLDQAGTIADEQIAQLQAWLEKHWNATPRDTAMIERLLKVLPGGEKLTRWSEAAPYLLAIVVATHHAFFGHIDLMILGGYSLATWLTEKINNQVANRTRAANNAIAQDFTELVKRQIDRTCTWLNNQAPTAAQIRSMTQLMETLSELANGQSAATLAPSFFERGAE